MQNITPVPHQDQTRALRGAAAAAEAYPILSQHWPNFTELLAAERRRQLLPNQFDHPDQHNVQVAGDDHWPEPPLLIAEEAQ